MAYSRHIAPNHALEGEALTAAMAGIGINFAATPSKDANIEDTLFFAVIEGMEKDDLRVLASLATWFEKHHQVINADRLIRIVQQRTSPRVRAWWKALATWMRADRRFTRLTTLYKGPRIDLLLTGTDFHIARHGEDPRFEKTCLRVPNNVLRNRDVDVLCAPELAKRHRAYRTRILMGPSYRADLWAALEDSPNVTASDLARKTYASFASAWEVKQAFAILRGDGPVRAAVEFT